MCLRLTQEWITKTLAGFGLSTVDSKIYILLEKNGPLTARKMTEMLKLHRQQLYRILGRLEKAGLVNSSGDRPKLFSALTFEEILDMFLKNKSDQARRLSVRRDELLLHWRIMIERKKD
jgi:HTH-type transcriptional regulator, sugar sensing transcriptional regulator